MKKHIFNTALIIILGLLVYSNTFHVPFQLDDSVNIAENKAVRDISTFNPLSGTGISRYSVPESRYIGYLSFALNYRLHGLDVAGYHVVNLLVHILNALLLYSLVLLTFRTPFMRSRGDTSVRAVPVALFSALLFAGHPVQTQAVTYIVQRLASLATLFYLLSVAAYVQSRLIQTGKPERAFSLDAVSFYAVSLLSAVLAMKTKEISFTLPVVIVLYEFLFFDGKVSKRVVRTLPFLLTMSIIPLSLIGAGRPVGELIGDVSRATAVQTQMPRLDYLFTQFRVIVTYIRLIFFPVNQNLLYDYPVYRSFLNPPVMLSFIFHLSILACSAYLILRSRRTDPGLRLISFGILWFFIALSVESSVIPIADVIYEHRLYLPSAGAFLSITASVYAAVSRLKRKRVYCEKAVVAVFVIIIMVFSAAAYNRNTVWRSRLALWEDVVSKNPDHAGGLNNLALAYAAEGRTEDAIRYFEKAIASCDDFTVAYLNLADLHVKNGQPERAIEYYEKIIGMQPDNAEVLYNLGIVHGRQGRFGPAIDYFGRAIKADKDYAEAYENLGVVYARMGRFDIAIKYFREAIGIKDNYAEAYNHLGLAYFRTGRTSDAVKQYQHALRLRPDYREVHYNIGTAYAKMGMKDKAAKHFGRAEILKGNRLDNAK